MTSITPRDLAALRQAHNSYALLDVRELGEAEAGHIFGATYLPRRRLELRISELVPARSTPIVVYDEGEGRAELAAATLRSLGYTQVMVLAGGLPAWAENVEPISTGSNVPSKKFGEEISESSHTPSVAATEAARWRDEGQEVLFCDIRTPEEYARNRIPGAYRTAGFDVTLAASLLSRSGVKVVVNCAGRTRSIIACETLRRLGLEDVYALENGTMGWVLAGFELEKGEGTGPIEPTPASREGAKARAEQLAVSVGVKSADPEEVEGWIRERDRGSLNLYAFDVRQTREYEGGHIGGTATLPGALAVQRTDEFVAVRSARIVLVDDDEVRANITGYWLRLMGLPEVVILKGGIPAWMSSGRSLVTGRDMRRPVGLDAAKLKASPISGPQLARAMHEGGATTLDIGTSREVEAGHLQGSLWLPRGWLELRVATVVPDRDTRVIVVGRDDAQSIFAAAALSDLGYRNVSYLEGGLDTVAGVPMQSGLPSDQAANDVILPPYAQGVEGMKRYLEWEKRLTTGAH